MTAGRGFWEAKIASSIRGCILRQQRGISPTGETNKRTAADWCYLTEKPMEVSK